MYKCDTEDTKKAQTETLFYLSRSRKVPEQTYIHENSEFSQTITCAHMHTCYCLFTEQNQSWTEMLTGKALPNTT